MKPDWDDIVRQNAAGVVNAAIRVVGRSADAEDIAQDVFLEAFERWSARPLKEWGGLLRRMAVCRALDHLRRNRRLDALPDSIRDASAVDPYEVAVARELEERLRDGLGHLPSREAEVFCLHYFEQLAQDQIAELLGIARGAVATALCKARTKLATQLEEVSEGEQS